MSDEIVAEASQKQSRVRWGCIVGVGAALIVICLGLLFLVLALAGTFYTQPQPGDPAPDFTLGTYDGSTYTLSELRGQVVVINFWASWCAPCGEEADDLELAWQTYRDRGVMFLGIDYVDSGVEGLGYLEQYAVTYPNGPDLRSRISDAYRIQGVPETFIVNGAGTVTFFAERPITYSELSAAIEAALAGGGE
jgi:cytochrome c biogenesis protein CcmG/thiol:disulfide interchange protein DsbE